MKRFFVCLVFWGAFIHGSHVYGLTDITNITNITNIMIPSPVKIPDHLKRAPAIAKQPLNSNRNASPRPSLKKVKSSLMKVFQDIKIDVSVTPSTDDDKENISKSPTVPPKDVSQMDAEPPAFTPNVFPDIVIAPPLQAELYQHVTEPKHRVLIEILHKVLHTPIADPQTLQIQDVVAPDRLQAYKDVGGDEDELLGYIKDYKKIRPYVVKNKEESQKIDIAILRLLGYSRHVLIHLTGIIASPPQKAYHAPYKELTAEERRSERHAQKNAMRNFNLLHFPGKIDFQALESNIMRPFQNWTINHQKAGTDTHVDMPSINLMMYRCLKEAIKKDLYRPFFSEGYIWIIATEFPMKWENEKGDNNLDLLANGCNPVDAGGTPLEAHHIAGDYVTHKSLYYTEYDHGKAPTLSLKERFRTSCVMVYLTKKVHGEKGTHIWNCSPDRKMFARERVRANKSLLYPHFAK